MIDVKPILRTAVIAQAAALAGRNLALLRKKKKKARHFLGAAAGTIVGTSLIKSQADFIEGM